LRHESNFNPLSFIGTTYCRIKKEEGKEGMSETQHRRPHRPHPKAER
jgi:hypothetical protein